MAYYGQSVVCTEGMHVHRRHSVFEVLSLEAYLYELWLVIYHDNGRRVPYFKIRDACQGPRCILAPCT